jgi:hypothetical protein
MVLLRRGRVIEKSDFVLEGFSLLSQPISTMSENLMVKEPKLFTVVAYILRIEMS